MQERVPPPPRETLQAVLLALLCALLFVGPALLPGTVLVPYPPEFYDVQGAEAVAAGRFDAAEVGRGNVSMGDKYGQSLCWDRVLQQHLRQGHVPLWNREIGGGVPFVPQMAQPYQPWNLLLLVLPAEQWYGWVVFLHLLLTGTFAYGFVRRLGCRHGSGLLAVVLAVLGLWMQCKLHHNVMLTAALSAFPMLSCVHDLMRHRGGAGRIAWLGIWTGLGWLSGFVVIALQSAYLAIGYAALLAAGNAPGERLRPLLRVAAGLLLGGALSLAQMGPLLLAIPESSRPPVFDVAAHRLRSLDWDYLLTLAWPDLFHWARDTFYAGVEPGLLLARRPPLSQLVLLHDAERANGSWVECSLSVSIAGLCAALAAFADRRRRALALACGGLAVLAFGMATGSQPFFALVRALPGLAATDVRRQLFFLHVAMVVLAALGADRLLDGGRVVAARLAAVLVAVASAVATVWLWRQDEAGFTRALAQWIAADAGHPQVHGTPAAAIADLIGKTVWPGQLRDNLDHLRTTAWRAWLAATVTAVALWWPRPRLRLALLLAAAGLELWHAGLGPVQTVAPERVRTAPAVVQPVLAASQQTDGVRPRLQRLGARQDPRAAGLYLPNLAAYHGLEDACAYSSLPPLREEEFFLAIEPNAPDKSPVLPGGDGVFWFHDPASLQHPLCDLFGIRFVLTDQPGFTGPALVDRTPPGTGRFRLLERTSTLPRATFVRAVDVLPDHDARLRALRDVHRDVGHRVVLEDETAPQPKPGGPDAADVAVVRHADERVEVRVRNAADGYLRLADAWDAGWRASVDGAPAVIWRADHYLRAVWLPPGEHVVVFTFDAPRVVWPARLSLLALVVAVAMLLARRGRRAAVQ